MQKKWRKGIKRRAAAAATAALDSIRENIHAERQGQREDRH